MENCILRRIDDLGRIGIPKDFRRKLKIHKGDQLSVECIDGKLISMTEQTNVMCVLLLLL